MLSQTSLLAASLVTEWWDESLKCAPRSVKMAQWGRAHASEPDDQSWIPETKLLSIL